MQLSPQSEPKHPNPNPNPNPNQTISHPELSKLFDGCSTTPHHGREYRPSPRLRLWQQKRIKEEQAMRRKQVFTELKSIGAIGSTRSNH